MASQADQFNAELSGSGTLTDREYSRLLAKTGQPAGKLSIRDLYALASEIPRLIRGKYSPVGPAPPSGYRAKAQSMGAVLIQHGTTEVVSNTTFTGSADYTSTGTNPAGHPKGRMATLTSLRAAYTVPSINGYTLVGATSLDGASAAVPDFNRLLIYGNGFIGAGSARTAASIERHLFARDPSVWHFFALVVDQSAAAEISTVYRDGAVYNAAITRDDGVNFTGAATVEFGGGLGVDRQVGDFAAGAVFNTALSPAQISELYTAYLAGP